MWSNRFFPTSRKKTAFPTSPLTGFTDEEAKWVTTACQIKAPGADAISVRLLRTAWPSIGHAVRALFEDSLRLNHFPKAFKLAEVILLPKPGRNPSTAKG